MDSVENYKALESQEMAAPSTNTIAAVDASQKQPGYLKTYLTRPQIQGTNIIDSLGRNPNWMLNYTPPVRVKGAGFPIYKTDERSKLFFFFRSFQNRILLLATH